MVGIFSSPPSGGGYPPLLLTVDGGNPVLDPLEIQQLLDLGLANLFLPALTQTNVAPPKPPKDCCSLDGSTPPLSAPGARFSCYLYSPSTFQTSPAQSSYSLLANQFISLGGDESFFAPLSHLVQDTKPIDLTPEQTQALVLALLPQQPPSQQPPSTPTIYSSAGPIRRKRTNLPSVEDGGGGDGESATDDSEERRHKCDVPECTRAFKRLFNLKAHKHTHNPDRDRPFSYLTRHQPVHTKLKEWSCERCGKGFTRRTFSIGTAQTPRRVAQSRHPLKTESISAEQVSLVVTVPVLWNYG
ncbi:hypothetical protein BJ742DRAFT_744740 [Cladochytrium replicatum]|nr:hypothetical protein BJ742DRAFT_744740 [Cladochytrium replicatum]